MLCCAQALQDYKLLNQFFGVCCTACCTHVTRMSRLNASFGVCAQALHEYCHLRLRSCRRRQSEGFCTAAGNTVLNSGLPHCHIWNGCPLWRPVLPIEFGQIAVWRRGSPMWRAVLPAVFGRNTIYMVFCSTSLHTRIPNSHLAFCPSAHLARLPLLNSC